MVDAVFWFALSQLVELDVQVLVLGDWRQLGPVEDGNRTCDDHPIVHYVCRGHRVELKRSEHCRYDHKLELAPTCTESV